MKSLNSLILLSALAISASAQMQVTLDVPAAATPAAALSATSGIGVAIPTVAAFSDMPMAANLPILQEGATPPILPFVPETSSVITAEPIKTQARKSRSNATDQAAAAAVSPSAANFFDGDDIAHDKTVALNVPDPVGRLTIQRLAAQPFNDPIYSKPFFKTLTKPKESSIAKFGWKARTARELDALAEKFKLPKALNGRLDVNLQLLGDAKDSDPHLTLLGIFTRRNGIPAGSFASTIETDKNGRVVSHIHSVYLDRSDPILKGIAPAFLAFLRREVYPAVGVQKEILKADHAGRYVWAKQGFQFDPTYWLKDVGGVGPPIKLPELARRNFYRFLKINGIRPTDLILYGKPLASLEDLQTPADFASVVERKGKKIVMRPFVRGVLQEPATLDVGKAFMLADYRPQDGQFVVSMARTKFSTAAMPYWNGWKDVP